MKNQITIIVVAIVLLGGAVWLIRGEGERFRESVNDKIDESTDRIVTEGADRLVEKAADESKEVMNTAADSASRVIESTASVPGKILDGLNEGLGDSVAVAGDLQNTVTQGAGQAIDQAAQVPGKILQGLDGKPVPEGLLPLTPGQQPQLPTAPGAQPGLPPNAAGLLPKDLGSAIPPSIDPAAAAAGLGQAGFDPRQVAANAGLPNFPTPGNALPPNVPAVPSSLAPSLPAAAQPGSSQAAPRQLRLGDSYSLIPGFGDAIRAQGQYNLLTSEAAVNLAEARRRELRNRMNAVQGYYALRQQNHQIRFGDYPLRKAVNQQRQMVRYGQAGRPDRLSLQDLDPITGKIEWPTLLQAKEYDAHRTKLDELFRQRSVSGAYVSRKAQEDIETAANGMLDVLRQDIRTLPTKKYIEARRFVQNLAFEASRTSV